MSAPDRIFSMEEKELYLRATPAREHAEELVEALREIRDWRKSCHDHDRDMGQDLREFDAEDVKLMEYAARATLAKLEKDT